MTHKECFNKVPSGVIISFTFAGNSTKQDREKFCCICKNKRRNW